MKNFLLLACMITSSFLGWLRASGQAHAVGALAGDWADWSIHDAAPRDFSQTAGGVIFERAAGTSDPYLSRKIPYGKHFFKFKIRYRTDGKLAPTVLIFLPPAVDLRPLTVIRLPAVADWTDFETEAVAHDPKGAALEMRLYPGTVGPDFMKRGGLAPIGHHAGRAEFASMSWTEIPRPALELTKGPVPFTTTKIVFKTIGSLELKVHVDRPAGIPPGQPAVIWFHGGGFIGGTPDNCLPQATYLASRGILCIRPQYRLVSQGGNADVTLDDARDAVAWIKQHAADLGIDSQRVILAGTSAGAVLGSVLAQHTPECIGFIGLAGYYDAVTPGNSAGIDQDAAFFLYGKEPAMLKRISAIYQIHQPPPPTYLIHGLLDSTLDCRQSAKFADALKAAGGRVELDLIPWLNHVPNFAADEAFAGVEKFIRELQANPTKAVP